jgi:hypothetical protein
MCYCELKETDNKKNVPTNSDFEVRTMSMDVPSQGDPIDVDNPSKRPLKVRYSSQQLKFTIPNLLPMIMSWNLRRLQPQN